MPEIKDDATKQVVNQIDNFLRAVVNGLLEESHAEDTKWEILEGRKMVSVLLVAPKPPVGRLIGKQGNHARAINTLIVAMAARVGKKATVSIDEGPPMDLEVDPNSIQDRSQKGK